MDSFTSKMFPFCGGFSTSPRNIHMPALRRGELVLSQQSLRGAECLGNTNTHPAPSAEAGLLLPGLRSRTQQTERGRTAVQGPLGGHCEPGLPRRTLGTARGGALAAQAHLRVARTQVGLRGAAGASGPSR